MTETTDDVVSYHPDGLHVGIDDGGTNEIPGALSLY
jgi:hypothetical protein